MPEPYVYPPRPVASSRLEIFLQLRLGLAEVGPWPRYPDARLGVFGLAS
jgi:hypothetical protein